MKTCAWLRHACGSHSTTAACSASCSCFRLANWQLANRQHPKTNKTPSKQRLLSASRKQIIAKFMQALNTVRRLTTTVHWLCVEAPAIVHDITLGSGQSCWTHARTFEVTNLMRFDRQCDNQLRGNFYEITTTGIRHRAVRLLSVRA